MQYTLARRIPSHPTLSRVETESGGTRRRTGGEVKGKEANGVGSHQSSVWLGTVHPVLIQSFTPDPHSKKASTLLNWHTRRYKWTHPFRWKTESGFCACAITFRFHSTFQVSWYGHWTICGWVCESGGKNKASNASDKPPSWVHHLPAGSITRFTKVRVRELKSAHNSVTVQNRTHVYMNFFDHKDLGNHLLQLCPKVVKHPVCVYIYIYIYIYIYKRLKDGLYGHNTMKMP